MNYDQDKMKDLLFNSPSYKHVNSYLPVITTGFDVEKHIQRWMEIEDNLKFLNSMELILATKNYNVEEYQNLLKEVQNHQQIKIEDWCNRTKGQTLLAVNGHIFANEYVNIRIAQFFGDAELKDLIKKQNNLLYESDKDYEHFFINQQSYTLLTRDNQLLALHLLAESDRYWFSIWYSGQMRLDILQRRSVEIVGILTL